VPATLPAAAPVDNAFLLAVERTRLAHERTLIAWLRTALSMISFGFTIYKFFQLEIDKTPALAAGRLLSPRGFALIMIGTGLVALLMSTIQHRQSMQRLRAESGAVIVPVSIATVVAALFSILGVLAFLAVLLQE
jgi:putative membrane protein